MITKCHIILAVSLTVLTSLVHGQETPSTEVSGTPDGTSDTSAYPKCPGECVHAFTAFFCERILEHAKCDVTHYSCCVPKDLSFGTLVETSPPLSDDSEISTEPNLVDGDQYTMSPQDTGNYGDSLANDDIVTTTTTASPTVIPPYYTRVKPKPEVQPTAESYRNNTNEVPPPPVVSSTENELPVQSPTVYVVNQQQHPCKGLCVENQYAKYCANVVRNAVCEQPGRTCCLPDNTPAPNNATNDPTPNPRPPSLITSNPKPTPSTDSYPTPIINQHGGGERPLKVQPSQPDQSNEQQPPTSPESNCPGTCVNSFFSLLCDKIDYSASCQDGGFCCVSNSNDDVTTTTEETIGPCPGTCVLTVLSGFCNRPSELIVKTTDCNADTICCYLPPDKNIPEEEPPQDEIPQPYQPPEDSSLNYPEDRPIRKPAYFNTRPQHQPNQIPPRPITRPNTNYNVQPYQPNPSGSYGYPDSPKPNPYGYPETLPKPQQPNQGVQSGGQYLGHVPNQYDSQTGPYGNQGNHYGNQGNQYGSVQPGGHYVNPDQPSGHYQNQDQKPGEQYPNSGIVFPERMDVRPSNAGQMIPNRVAAVGPNINQGAPDGSYNPQGPQGVIYNGHGHGGYSEQASYQNGKIIPSRTDNGGQNGQLVPMSSQNNPNTGPNNVPVPQMNPNQGQIGPQNNGYGIAVPQDGQMISITQPGQRYQPNGQVFPHRDQAVSATNQFYPHPQRGEQYSPNHRPPYSPVKPRPQPQPHGEYPQPQPQPQPHGEYPRPQPQPQPQGEYPPPQPVTPAPAVEPVQPEKPPVEADTGYEYPPLPSCTGHCVSPFFRFTCSGNNAIYNGLSCPKAGMLCCAPMNEIQKYEDILRPGAIAANKNYTSISTVSGISNVTTTTTTTTTTPKPVLSVVRKPPGRYVCGVKGTSRVSNARVTGGSDSLPGEWCWQVALINSQNQYLCGAALIASQWVLTAAHCVTTLVRNGESIFARVGDYDLKSKKGSPDAQTRKISTTYIHHNHNSQTLDNDIALLKLQTPVELSDNVCLVCLPARGTKHKAGKRCTVTGYGYQGETGPIALKIREAEIPIVEEQDCAVQINAVTEKLFILPASSFCAGGEAGSDACQGDGGGPLVCKVDNFFELTGLVSWGFGCGRESVPGVYVKVSAFIGWVNQIISVNSS